MKILISILALISFHSTSFCWSVEITKDSVLVLGTSAQPPTFAHGLLLAQLQQRFHFRNLFFAPTKPYKKGVELGTTALELSQVSMKHFNEILDYGKIPYHDFDMISEGHSQYVSKAEDEIVQVEALSTEFLAEHSEGNSSRYFLPIYRDLLAKGNPRQFFWISGSDSVASVKSWSPYWREFFQTATWVIVSRAGDDKVDVTRTNPLLGVIDDEWLGETFDYEDMGESTHQYHSKNSSHPDILVLSLDIPIMSSSEVRALLKDLAKDLEKEAVKEVILRLEEKVQPSVLERILERGYYSVPLEAPLEALKMAM